MKEELDAAITDVTLLNVTENIFTFFDTPCHEIVFIYAARFADPSFYDKDTIIGDEVGQKFTLFWVDPGNLPDGIRIFPTGLEKHL